MKDVLEVLRPKLKLFESYAEACEASDKLDQEFRAKLGKTKYVWNFINETSFPTRREEE